MNLLGFIIILPPPILLFRSKVVLSTCVALTNSYIFLLFLTLAWTHSFWHFANYFSIIKYTCEHIFSIFLFYNLFLSYESFHAFFVTNMPYITTYAKISCLWHSHPCHVQFNFRFFFFAPFSLSAAFALMQSVFWKLR